MPWWIAVLWRTIGTVQLALVAPMLASSGTGRRTGPASAESPNGTGGETVVYVDSGGVVRVRTRAGRQVADALPNLADLFVDALDERTAILDGQLVAAPRVAPDL